VDPQKLHLDRARAESFGSVAEQYDRYRQVCPDALADDLAALRPERVLDVGCGTGKTGVALLRRGLSVLGVELDERMAEIARGHGLRVEIAPFETWDDAGRRFDLITCGDSWHWIDPGPGVPKVAKVLRSGGTIARFWNYYVLDEPVVAAFEAVYDKHAPQAHAHGRAPGIGAGIDPFADHPAFGPVETRTYRWERMLSADEWVGLVATFSDHQRLGEKRLTVLQRALRETIATLDGTVNAHGETYVMIAWRL